ncbi:DUF3592 domain-containing protein [Halomonas sp. 328]|uniref:DUF3592 domain-containing protein n=1 Tax=Halomonas sp. 328 TaxID=2776704 RepID=UPI0018A7A73B|nr:DUF3592 domain-containing protein [Halomonas sp. 328]MBF8224136.1 DUF3592 domain-containing protein [Halomonas sp. 328]
MTAALPWLVALAAAVGSLFSARAVWRRRDLNRWPVAEAVVTASELVTVPVRRARREHPEPPPRYQARIAIALRVAGHDYHTDNTRFDAPPLFTRREEAAAYLADYPEGRRLAVRYRPDDPRCAQVGGATIPWRRLGLSGFLALMALVALVFALRG